MAGVPNGVRRGAAVSIGTPPQTLAFASGVQVNDTRIFDALNNPCVKHSGSDYTDPNATYAQCFTQYGGLFYENRSSTWRNANSASDIGIGVDDIAGLDAPNYGKSAYGIDTISPSSNVSINDQPLVIDLSVNNDTSAYFENTLGLGKNSTLLNGLYAAGKIASRTWSIYEGWTGAERQNQTNGSLVLGGYDAAQTKGKNITVKFATDPGDEYQFRCNMVVTVRDMQLRFANGSNASLFDSTASTAVPFCIIPTYSRITLTNAAWTDFLSLTGTSELTNGILRSSSYLSWYNNLVSSENAYTGDLVISIDPGLDITIPNHELVRPYVNIDGRGQEYIVNGSEVRLMSFSSLDDAQQKALPVLGRNFLSAAYLMVDNDQQQFTLWQGQPSVSQDLRVAGPPTCSSSSVPTPSASKPTTNISEAVPLPSNGSLSKGAIAGVLIAALSIVATCFGIGYLLARKRSQKQRREVVDINKHSSMHPDSSPPLNFKAELPSDQQPPQEIPSGKGAGDDIPPYEMNGQTAAVEVSGEQKYALELPGDSQDALFAKELPGSEQSSRGSSTTWSMKELPATPTPRQVLPPLPPSLKANPGTKHQSTSGDGPPKMLSVASKEKPLPRYPEKRKNMVIETWI